MMKRYVRNEPWVQVKSEENGYHCQLIYQSFLFIDVALHSGVLFKQHKLLYTT
jgi:hypothetical protein